MPRGSNLARRMHIPRASRLFRHLPRSGAAVQNPHAGHIRHPRTLARPRGGSTHPGEAHARRGREERLARHRRELRTDRQDGRGRSVKSRLVAVRTHRSEVPLDTLGALADRAIACSVRASIAPGAMNRSSGRAIAQANSISTWVRSSPSAGAIAGSLAWRRWRAPTVAAGAPRSAHSH
jgi:hypothetical protein